MYKAHRNIQSRLCRLSKTLEKEKGKVKTLQKLYDAGKFEFITENLNEVTKAFINSQLRNVSCQPTARRWTDEDKAFALSLYKRSPRLYKYLQVHFQLPSSRTLKAILAKIQFDTGINPGILEHLKNHVSKMKHADRYCLMRCRFVKDFIMNELNSGYEDMGSLGRTNKAVNHALVFMIRRLRLQWKQVIAYYFTANTVSANNLKFLIEEIISQLQNIGLTVVATVCDQGTTNVSALNQLYAKQHPSKVHIISSL
ncbi:DNA transposase THAP9-like Protein [Tribolium castaneum]|uniref:DNA transposase THAP9-like Protein n=1 Tax=Tribolium castaneum TaxID=7070 RepID=D7GYF7_TRICA|nr:DNA transposase THAP9-like Protein [Tribolium castaneum]